jgi:hypothetical protein
MGRIEDRREFANRPSLERETDWCAAQLRVIFRLIQLETTSNPLMLSNPPHYLNSLNKDIGLVPGLGMYAFWLIAIRSRMPDESCMDALCNMYAATHSGATFRSVAFPGYKANRKYIPLGRGKRP